MVRSPRPPRSSRRLTCPSVLVPSSSFSSQAHLTASARFRVRAPGPVSGRLSQAADGGVGHPARVSRCLSATGISLLGHPIPARGLGLPCGRLTEPQSPDPDGVTTFHTHELRPGWVPPIPRGRRCSSRLSGFLTRRLPLPSGQSLHPAATSHLAGPNLTRHQSEVHVLHPSGLPLACSRRMERQTLGLSPELRTPPTKSRTTHVGVGTGHRARARNNAHDITSADPPIRVARSSSCDLVSQTQLLPHATASFSLLAVAS